MTAALDDAALIFRDATADNSKTYSEYQVPQLRSALMTPSAHYSRCSTARASPGSLEPLSHIDIIGLSKPGLLEPVTVLKAAGLAKCEELLTEASKARFLSPTGLMFATGLVRVKLSYIRTSERISTPARALREVPCERRSTCKNQPWFKSHSEAVLSSSAAVRTPA
ncbi:hypothetical protein OH76DRAFT_1483008 [Lentinus brumalis]|uniref:Uncharacterized protein n=1 Tax=Lentinus brumalis TaxID=2498619 RepID=A0A371DAX4_9APHY|nr:hypothetical protein OH76DRAFT_1483008 [Polyporus brumalis]